jgi:hypothetical protein
MGGRIVRDFDAEFGGLRRVGFDNGWSFGRAGVSGQVLGLPRCDDGG